MPFLGKSLLIVGALLFALGLLVLLAARWHLTLGRLPGDLVIRHRRWVIYFPWASMLLLSILLTLILNLLRRH